ncbi:MAG: hypothetical protein BAJALOKI1v1_1020003 [Promethearchaeota archaeon]|nr:MAG: hypothetical protein BAJALOKI1v1_1020003 [Candidatus Lokiarchaeota archaeon]
MNSPNSNSDLNSRSNPDSAYGSNVFFITSTVDFSFTDSKMRDISYEAFLPEYETFTSKRSQIIMKKDGTNILKFTIESKDITAFRASINDIISFGKIIDNVMVLAKQNF